MKFLISLLATLLIFTSAIDAQIVSSKEVTYEVGTPYQVIDSPSKNYFYNDGNIIAVKFRKKDMVIQRMDAATLKSKSLKIYDDMPKDFIFEGILELNNKLYLFYSLVDKSRATRKLYHREIDWEKGTFIGTAKVLTTITGKTTYLAVTMSADKNKFMVRYRMVPKKKNDSVSHDIIGFRVYNQDLQEEWASDVKMPYTEKKMNNIDYALDNTGNVYILTSIYKDDTTKRWKKDGSINYHLELLKIDEHSQELSNTKIDLEGHFINGVWMYETDEGQMICAGFYNDDGKETSDAKGIFVAKIGEFGRLKDFITHEIPMEIITQYASAKQIKQSEKKNKKDKSAFQELVLRKLITYDDGSIVLVGEQHYVVVRTSTNSNGNTTSTTTFYYNDMLITKIAADGSLAWMKKLPKRQIGGRGQGSMSFRHFFQNDSHYMFFLDNIKNIDLAPDEVPSRHMDGAGGYLTAYKVDNNTGEPSKLSILNIRETPEVSGGEVYQFKVSRIIDIKENEFVVEFYKKKKEDILIRFKIE